MSAAQHTSNARKPGVVYGILRFHIDNGTHSLRRGDSLLPNQ